MAASKSTTFSESNISTANNTSSLTINIYFSPNNTQTWFASKTLYCTCNGVTQSANVSLNTGGSVSYSFTFNNIAHNSNGSKSVSWSWSCATGTSVLGTIGDSGTRTLTTIARYFTNTPSISLSSRTETALKIKWTTSETCDRVDYNINGATTTSAWTGSAKTGTISINNLSPNTSYRIYFWCRRKDSQLGTITSTSTYTTYDYPYCSTTPNFTIGNSVTLSFYNPLKRSMEVTIIAADGSTKAPANSTSTSISGFNNAEWQDFFYQSIPNASSGKYQVRVVYGSSTKTRNNNNTYSITGYEKPILADNDFTYTSNLSTLTGNDKTIIKGYSTTNLSLYYDELLERTYQADAQNYATISKYVFQIGNQSATLTDINSSVSINNADSNIIQCTAVDSRGLTFTANQTVPSDYYVDYFAPRILEATTTREDGVKTTTSLNLTGQIYDGTFGIDGISNYVNSIKYAVSTDNENWSEWYNVNVSNIVVTNGNFSISDYNIHANGSSGGFVVGTKYYVKLYIDDALENASSYIYRTELTSGVIARDVYKDGNNEYHEGINGLADDDYTETIHGTLNVTDTIYIDGVEITQGGGGGTGTTTWGRITGTLSNQTDLQNALDNKANANAIPTRTSQLTNDSNFVNNLSTSVMAGDGLVSTIISDNNIFLGLEEPMPTKTSDLTNDSGFITNVKTINGTSLVGSGNVAIEPDFSDAVLIRTLTSNELQTEAEEYDTGTATIELVHTIGMFDLQTGERLNYNDFYTRASKKVFYVTNIGLRNAESCDYNQASTTIICGSTLGDATITITSDNTYDYTAEITGGSNFTNIISSFQNFIGYDDNRIYDYSSTSAGYTKGMFVKDGTGKIYKCLMTGDYPLTNTSAWQRIDFYDVISKESDIVYYNKSDIMSITSTGDDVYLSLLEAITNNIAIGIVENSAVYTSYHEVLYYNKYTNDDAIYLYYMGDEEEYIQIAIKDTDGTFEATETTKIGLRSIKSQVNTNTNNITSNTTNIATLTTNVGALSSLGTTSKTSLVSAVNELNNRDIYSTSEKVIGKWTDGKPLYRKTISIGALPKTSTKTVNTGLTFNSTHCILRKIYGTANYTTGVSFPLPFINALDLSIGVSVLINSSSKIEITTGNDRSSATGFVTLEYTKATD